MLRKRIHIVKVAHERRVRLVQTGELGASAASQHDVFIRCGPRADQRFFGDASYAIIGPYIAEAWPNRLRAGGMRFSCGVGNLGNIIGPLGLALIARLVRSDQSEGDDRRVRVSHI